MHFYIVFENSNDCIQFESTHHDLVLEYIDFVNNSCANRFSLLDKKNISQAIEKLHKSINEINKTVITDLAGKFSVPKNKEDFLDQYYLNKTHAQWVNHVFEIYKVTELKSSNHSEKLEHLFEQLSDDIEEVTLPTIVHKFNLEHLHSSINENIHAIESKFSLLKFKADFDNWIERKNIFKNYASNSIANFRISFNHYGRTQRNKFVYHDVNLEHPDENNYNQLLGFVELSLNPVETIGYSPEYIAWCKKNNTIPMGEYLNLGNIVNLEKNLLHYRKILHRNLEKNNHFKITVNKDKD